MTQGLDIVILLGVMRILPGDDATRLPYLPEAHRIAVESIKSVYLLRHAFRPWLKVGVAKDIRRRMPTYRHAWGVEPFPPLAVHGATLLLMSAHAYEMEYHLLHHFRADRVGGEWLRPSPGVRTMERAALVLHQDTKIDYAEAVVPFARAIDWPDTRLRFKKRLSLN